MNIYTNNFDKCGMEVVMYDPVTSIDDIYPMKTNGHPFLELAEVTTKLITSSWKYEMTLLIHALTATAVLFNRRWNYDIEYLHPQNAM